MVATQNNLSEMLQLKPQVLHISCHGIEKSGGTSLTKDEENRFLLLEDDNGMGKLVSEKILNSLITKMMPDLELVFVAACQSEFVGGIFSKCGASHVVCVKQSKHVLDEAAIHFTKCFY